MNYVINKSDDRGLNLHCEISTKALVVKNYTWQTK